MIGEKTLLQTNFELGIFNAYLLLLIYFVLSILPFVFKRNKRLKEISPTNVKGDDFAKAICWLCFIVFILAFIVSFFLPIVFNSIFFYIGIVLWIIGIIIVSSVFISWVKTSSGKPVTTGAYKYSRNPMYISFFFTYIGVGIVSVSWVFLMLTFVYIFITIIFVEYEEKTCIEKYGDAYRIYMKDTPRWISFSRE